MARKAVNSDRTLLERDIDEWTEIINTIEREMPMVIRTRETDHEYREDDRNIEYFDYKKVNISVDSLPYNLEQPKHREFIKKLLECYFFIIDEKRSI